MEKFDKLVVSIYGGPGVGKTTLAAELFAKLKKDHREVEYVHEVAKEYVLEGNFHALSNQILLFGQQLYRLECAYRESSISILDSPLLLNCVYNPQFGEHFHELILSQYHRFNNFNIVISRNYDWPHSMSGRVHTQEQSIDIDHQIISLLEEKEIPYIMFGNDEGEFTSEQILELIKDVCH